MSLYLEIILKILVLSISLGAAILFLWGPGFLFFHRFKSKFAFPEEYIFLIVPIFSGLLGYFVFWTYFLNRWIGRGLSLTLTLGTIFLIIQYFRRGGKLGKLKKPLMIIFLVCLFYNSLQMARRPTELTSHTQSVITGWQLPPDNVLPRYFATRYYQGKDPKDLGDTWHGSDRPPLQAGMWLMAIGFFPRLIRDAGYQAIASVLQAVWILVLFFLNAVLGYSQTRLYFILFCLIFNGFIYVNTVYVWPKLIAAGYCMFGAVLMLYRNTEKRSMNALLAGTALGLGMLSHGGTAFAIIPLFIMLFTSEFKLNAKRWALLILPLFFLMLPWSLYQKYYDPPGNRLLKMHLAGIIDVDSRSTAESLRDAYRAISFDQFWQSKKANLYRFWDTAKFDDWISLKTSHLRRGQFFSLFHALGLLNLGLILFLMGFGAKQEKKLIVLALGSLLVWIILMFQPSSTVLHQGSYVPPLILLYVAASTLYQVFAKWPLPILIPHLILYLIVWYKLPITDRHTGGWLWLTCSAVVLIILMKIYYLRMNRQN